MKEINVDNLFFKNSEFENDGSKLKYIKEKLPDCYICNLDGKVIVE